MLTSLIIFLEQIPEVDLSDQGNGYFLKLLIIVSREFMTNKV